MSDFTDPYPVDEPTTLSFDHDGDGFAETTYIDTTGDGVIDTVVERDPYTGATAVAADTTGDGRIDTWAIDHDGDGIFDEAVSEGTTVVADDPFGPSEAGPFAVEGGDPSGGDDDGIHGEPRLDIDYHQVQPGPVDCLPTSVAMALTEITGTEIPADELVAMANEHGFMNEAGMSAFDAVTLFENYGIEAEATSGSLDDLRAALAADEPIIVGIDAADVYMGRGGPFDPGMESGHAVVVTGIDDGPPGAVYINDPGFPDGAGVEIPLELFIDAWEDSENTMVVAQLPVADQAQKIDTGGDDAGVVTPSAEDGAFRRLFLLPLNFILEA